MGVYIKGMEMPKNCMLCPLCVEEADPANGEMCMVTGTLMPPCTRERLDNCPLAPVPPHGRLIDADALAKTLGITDMDCYKCAWGNHGFCGRGGDFSDACEAIEDAPTIIPAEEE